MVAYAAGFDACGLAGADADLVVDLAGAIERMAATVKTLAAVQSAESGTWRDAGERSAAHHLARRTGTSVGLATEALETALRLAALPGTSAGARAGELSAAEAAAISGAATLDRGAELRLLALARTASLSELRQECGRVRASAQPDPEARRRFIHERRHLRSWTDAEGAWHLAVFDNPEVGAQILTALEPLRDRLFKAARAEGVTRGVGG